jgi:hypothetical protein
MRSPILFAGLFSIVCAAAPATGDDQGYAYGEHLAAIPDVMPSLGFAAVAGQLPGPEHPAGTIVLARPLVGKGVTLTEWDLALKKVLREVRLGWTEDNVTIARSGDTLYLAADHPHVRFARVSAATLRVAYQVDFGTGTDARVATDGTLTVASWRKGRIWTIATLDANQRTLARMSRAVPSEYGPTPVRLAVLNGHAYAIVGTNFESHVLKMSSSLVVEKDIPHFTQAGTCLEVVSGHLLLGTSDGFEVLSADLDVLERSRNATESLPLFAADASGRVMRATGEFFVNSAQPPAARYPVDHSVDIPMPPLWVGDVPVLVTTSEMVPLGIWVAWIDLNDPNRLPLMPAHYDGP